MSSWTPCAEQLPDSDTSVMTFVPGDASEPVWPGYHDGHQWWAAEGWPLGNTVTHWQHFPDPPGTEPLALRERGRGEGSDPEEVLP